MVQLHANPLRNPLSLTMYIRTEMRQSDVGQSHNLMSAELLAHTRVCFLLDQVEGNVKEIKCRLSFSLLDMQRSHQPSREHRLLQRP
jgi:hypothetical protein